MRRPIILTRALAELLAGETHERVIDSAAGRLAAPNAGAPEG